MWNKNLQEPSPRIVLSTRLQPCPLALLFVAEDTENKFRAVKKLLVENHYEVLMVDAGAEKICTAHLNPRCQTEATNESLVRVGISCSRSNIDFPICDFFMMFVLYMFIVYPVSLRFCF